MKKWVFGLIIILMALWTPVFGEEFYKPQTSGTGIIGGQANEYWRQGNFGRLLMPEISAPTGNPPSNFGWLYVKDLAGASALYFENDAGSVVNLAGGSATAWDDIGNPDAAKTLTFSTYTTLFTGASTAADQWTFRCTGNFGDVSCVKIESLTGNPTDGTVLEVVSHDTDADALLVTANSINTIQVAGSGNLNLLGGTGTVTYTDWAFTADGLLTLTPDLGGTGITITPSAALTTGLDVSNANITNGVNLGATKLLGTTAVIDFTNFDVDASGNVTCASINAGTWKQDAIVPASAAPTTITLNGAGAGGVTVGGTSTGTITLGGGATLVNLPAATDMTLSGGTIGITDTGTGPTLSVTNNTITNSNLVTLSATAMTSGKGISFTTGTALTGAGLYIGYTDDAGITGKLIEVYNGAGDVFKVERYGKTTIAGSASGTTALGVTAGDVVITSGKLTQAGGAVTINHDSNYTVGIGTGTNTQAVTIGGGSNTVGINSTVWDVGTDGAFTGVKSIAMIGGAATSISLATDGAADDFEIKITGATDSSLILSSTGTGADALQITASAGGVLVSANKAAADQFKVSAAGAVAGNAINLATTDGGIVLTAGGAANGDITFTAGDTLNINPTGNLSSTIGGNASIAATGTMALSSSDWGISTTGVITKIASLGFDSGSVFMCDTVAITSAEIKNLVAAPKELIAAPGANKFIEVQSVVLTLDYGGTNVFTVGAADDLVIQYNTTGTDITASLETTGWLDQAAHTMKFVNVAGIAATASTNPINRAVELFNTGVDVGGNAGGDNIVRVQITYIIHSMTL